MTRPPDLEANIQAACEANDLARAATLAVEGYGNDIMAFLLSRMGTRAGVAEELFAMFAEKLWTGLPRFEWRCSMRSWMYRLARNAIADYLRAGGNRPERQLALSQHAALSQLVDHVRTTTAAYRRTDAKDRMRELREALSADDQVLLMLHVDRGFEFRELAEVLNEGENPLEGEALDREAARLRKRFERIKEQLRKLAEQRGLL